MHNLVNYQQLRTAAIRKKIEQVNTEATVIAKSNKALIERLIQPDNTQLTALVSKAKELSLLLEVEEALLASLTSDH